MVGGTIRRKAIYARVVRNGELDISDSFLFLLISQEKERLT